MRTIIFVVCLFWTVNSFALELTQQQYDNLDILHKAVKAKHADFLGFSGTKEDMKVVGNVSESDVKKEIDKVNLNTAITEKEEKIKSDEKKAILDKLGITENELTKLKNL